MLISQFLTFILLFPYKVSDKEADYFKATRTCEEDKGHLISLEDTEEIERLYKKKNATKDVTFFTSALYFSFENEWRWMSESSKIPINGILFPLEKKCNSKRKAESLQNL